MVRRDLVHGGALDAMRAAFQNAPEPWVDLSTGINPWSYPDTTVSRAALAHLPTQSAQDACVSAMASSIGAPPDSLLLAAGSELLIRLLPDAIRPRRVAVLSPTYGDHVAVWKRAGADVIETSNPLHSVASVDAVVITQPNNPNGRTFDLNSLEVVRQELAARGGWLIVDEAYADLIPEQSFASRGGADGLIILRSFGKFFGLAGVRFGAILAPANVRQLMAQRLGVWSVSGTALEIATRAYGDTAWQQHIRMKLSDAATRLDIILTMMDGMSVAGGTCLYRFVEISNAHQVFERFAQAGIYVRRFDWSPVHLRIGLPATAEAEARLRDAVKQKT